MKSFQTLLLRMRASLRTTRARAGLATVPAALHIRLDDLDAPPGDASPSTGAPRSLDDVQRDIAAWVRAFGPAPVHVTARATHPHLAETMRFAHRLEARVSLRTCARGLDTEVAARILETAPRVVRVRVAGMDDVVQGAVLDETVEEARAAIEALLTMRTLLGGDGATCAVRAAWVPTEAGAPHLRGIFDLARRAAMDGVDVEAPWMPEPAGPALRDALAWARAQHAPFHGTPAGTIDALLAVRTRTDHAGVARSGAGRCPVGGTRLEVRPDGSVTHCPIRCAPAPGAAPVPGSLAADARAALASLADQRRHIRACDRACLHPDVTPGP